MRRQTLRKIFKLIGVLLIALVLFLGVAAYTFYHLVKVGEFRRFLIREVENWAQMKVSVGEADLTIGRIMGVSFKDFVLLDPKGHRPVLKAQRVLVRVALLPLLERRLVFDELRLYRPTLQVTRDEWGQVPLVDLILSLPFREGGGVGFTLDLHGVKVENGEVLFRDHQKDSVPTVTRFREIDLTLRRVQTKSRSTPATELPLEVEAPRKGEAALIFSLKTAIEKDEKRLSFTSKGRVAFPDGSFELRQAWFDLDTYVEALPASLFWDYYGHLLPFKTVHGTLNSRLHWQGRLAEKVHVQGEMGFKGFEVHAPAFFTNPLTPGNGNLKLEMELTPSEIRFPQLDLRSDEVSLDAQGFMRSPGRKDPYLEVHLTTPFVPLLTARKYIPLRILDSPKWEYLVKTVDRGKVRLIRAGVAGHLSEIRRLSEPGFEKHIWLEAELLDAGGNLPGDRSFPVRDIDGRLVLEKGVLHYQRLKGIFGKFYLAEVDGSHKGVLTGRGLLELRVKGEVDLSQLREQLKVGFIPSQVAEVASSLQELSGTGKFSLLFRTDFASLYHYQGQVALENSRLQTGEYSLSRLRGNLSFSPEEIRAEKITALLAGSPLQIRLSLKNYLSDESAFDLAIESPGIKAGVVNRLLLSVGSPQDPGTVRGTIRYQGPFASSRERRLNGTLDFLGAHVPLEFFSQPLRDVSGRVDFDERGIDFQGLKGRVGNSDFEFSGQWRYRTEPQLVFTFNSPEMDLAHLLPQGDAAASDWYDQVKAKGKINIAKGRYEGFEFSDLKTDLTLDRGRWRLENFSAYSLGGTVQGNGSFADNSNGIRFAVEPRIQGIPINGFLGWFDLGTTRITGKISLSGNLESSGKTGPERKRNLSGAFSLRIEDGVIRRMRLLVRILSLLDLSRWFSLKMPDIDQKGIHFRSITGDFKVSRGVYSTENFLLDGEDLRITGAGEIDGPKGEVNFVVAVRPFPEIDSVVDFIPLIGQGLAGIKNSFLVASFRIKGPVDNPTVIPAPLKTLSEFFYGALAIPKELIKPLTDEKQ